MWAYPAWEEVECDNGKVWDVMAFDEVPEPFEAEAARVEVLVRWSAAREVLARLGRRLPTSNPSASRVSRAWANTTRVIHHHILP